ncbi:MAG: long-chain fatty acid--CoA ligase, partial [Bacteroidota bacterium]|nr:long-chain fatty acid--CoA ligase [Bacteroidota bacterium]
MTDPTRLFDCLRMHVENSPIPDMLAAKEGGKWRTYGTREVFDTVNKLTAALAQMGISGNDLTPEG